MTARGEEIFPTVWRWRLALFLAALGGVWLFWRVRSVLGTFLFAWLVAYILYPGVSLLERRGISRMGSVAILLLLVLSVLSVAGALLLPVLAEEVLSLAQSMPEWTARAKDFFTSSNLAAHLPASLAPAATKVLERALEAAQASLPELGPKIGLAILDVVWGAFGNVLGIVGGILNVLLFVTIVVYLLFDFPDVNDAALEFVPIPHRKSFSDLLAEIDTALKSVLRGQLSVGLAYGVILAIGWSLVGLDFAFLIGILSGLAYFIPYVGPAGGLGVALLVGGVEFSGDGFVPLLLNLGAILVVFGVGQLIESFLLTPYLVGRSAGLGPIAVMFAMALGGALWGVLGILFALPGAVIVKILLVRLDAAYKASDFYRGKEDATTGAT